MNPVLEKTLQDLEWSRLTEAVAARCRGPVGAKLQSLPLLETREGVEAALDETAEALTLLDRGEGLPLYHDGAFDTATHLARLEKQGALDGPGLRDIKRTLGAARVLRRFLSRQRETAPTLYARCVFDPSLDNLEDEIGVAIERDGGVSDKASPDIRRLRSEVEALRSRLTRKLEHILVDRADVLSDGFYTQRDGRYVVPVRRDAHEKFEGIVHGTSASGQSIFVEPRSLVTQGNRLKMAEAELQREIARILAALSALVYEQLASVGAAVDSLEHADLRNAAAVLGQDLDARVLPLAKEARVELRAARHPLLMLDGVAVVPNDLSVASGGGLVLSGPNAGGKTIALKTLGLTALMMRAGLPVPAADGSQCGFFPVVASDVGDDQNLHKNLSTFSAHITHLTALLEVSSEGALVLLDELAGGTDPGEGAALACAMVDTLCERGAAVAVTTHYEPLKAMATQDDRLRNAAVGFDVERMAPTFALTMDIPGASSALAVAQRFGIPESVVERARQVLPEQTRTFDQLVRALDAAKAEVEAERKQAEAVRIAAEETARKADERLAKLLEKDQRKIARATDKLYDELRKVRATLKEARSALRDARDDRALEEVHRKLQAAAESVAVLRDANQEPSSDDAGEAPGSAPLRAEPNVGDTVYATKLKREVRVLSAPKKGVVRVAAGPMKLSVKLSELRMSTAEPTGKSAPQAKMREEEDGPVVAIKTNANTLDVRGMRVDDAVAMVEQFLDRMYGAAEPYAYVLHGIGTGALRKAVRAELTRSTRYVASHRPGNRDEGGDRLTVVTLA